MKTINKLKRVGKVESDLVKVGTIVYDNGADSYYEVLWHEKDARGDLHRVKLGSLNLKKYGALCPVFVEDGEDLINEVYKGTWRYMIYR